MSGAERRFDELSEEMFRWFVREHPVAATYLGIHDYDDRMDDLSMPHLEENLKAAKGFLRSLRAIDRRRLDFDRRMDQEVLRTILERSIFVHEKLRMFERDPDYVQLLSEGVYPLFVREFAPAEARFRNIAARVAQADRLLEAARENVTRPVKIFCEIALEGIPRTLGFLKLISDAAPRIAGEGIAGSVGKAVEAAAPLIKGYEEHVKGLLTRADQNFAIGRAKMVKLLQLRRLPIKMEAMLRLARRVLKEKTDEMNSLARRIRADASWKEVNEILRSRAPGDFDQAFSRYRDVVEEARRFVFEKGLASIPEWDKIKLAETPPFVRHIIPTAAYLPPAPFEEDQTGLFFVTPVGDKPELLKEHAYPYIVTTVVHEAYPGHHLHLSWANRATSLARKLFYDAALGEGWAHYAEELMVAKGFTDDPEVLFAFSQDAAWRAARVIVDIGLHTAEMSFEEAVRFLMDTTGMTEERARREVKRYTLTPGQPLSYLVGKEVIKAIKERAMRRLGKRFSEKAFHDALMKAGGAPFPILEKIIFRALQEPLNS